MFEVAPVDRRAYEERISLQPVPIQESTPDEPRLQPEQMTHQLKQLGVWYEVDEQGRPSPNTHRFHPGQAFVALVQLADEDLNRAVRQSNASGGHPPIDEKHLTLDDVARLRERGLYRPDSVLGARLERARELHIGATEGLKRVRQAWSRGDEQGARNELKPVGAAHREQLQLHNGYSEQERAATGRWLAQLSGVHTFAESGMALLAGGAVTATTLAFLLANAGVIGSGAVMGLTVAITALLAGGEAGEAVSLAKRLTEEAVHVAHGEAFDRHRMLDGMVRDTRDALLTASTVVGSAGAVVRTAIAAVESSPLAVWAIGVGSGKASAGATVGVANEAMSQAYRHSTYVPRWDGAERPSVDLQALAVAGFSGAVFNPIGAWVGQANMLAVRGVSQAAVHRVVDAATKLATDVGTVALETIGRKIGSDTPLFGGWQDQAQIAMGAIAQRRAAAQVHGQLFNLQGRTKAMLLKENLPSLPEVAKFYARSARPERITPDLVRIEAGGLASPLSVDGRTAQQAIARAQPVPLEPLLGERLGDGYNNEVYRRKDQPDQVLKFSLHEHDHWPTAIGTPMANQNLPSREVSMLEVSREMGMPTVEVSGVFPARTSRGVTTVIQMEYLPGAESMRDLYQTVSLQHHKEDMTLDGYKEALPRRDKVILAKLGKDAVQDFDQMIDAKAKRGVTLRDFQPAAADDGRARVIDPYKDVWVWPDHAARDGDSNLFRMRFQDQLQTDVTVRNLVAERWGLPLREMPDVSKIKFDAEWFNKTFGHDPRD